MSKTSGKEEVGSDMEIMDDKPEADKGHVSVVSPGN